MYSEPFGSHFAQDRHHELLAEAEHARLVRLARAAQAPPRAVSSGHGVIDGVATAIGADHSVLPWRRPALWLGTLLVRWGEALQLRAMPGEATPEASIPW
jgi:hypothetical protein